MRGHYLTDKDYLIQSVNLFDGKQEKRFLLSNVYNKGWNELFSMGNDPFLSRIDGEPKFIELFMDTVVSINDQGIVPFLAIKSKDMLTSADVKSTDEYKDDADIRYVQLRGKNKIFGIHSFFENERIIYFRCNKGMQSQRVIYDRDTKSVIGNSLFNDFVYSGNSQPTTNFGFYDKKGVYECFEAGRFLSIPTSLIN